jgi:hypothetical protein
LPQTAPISVGTLSAVAVSTPAAAVQPAARSMASVKEAARLYLPAGAAREFILTGPDQLDPDPKVAHAQLEAIVRMVLTLRRR